MIKVSDITFVISDSILFHKYLPILILYSLYFILTYEKQE